MATFVDMINPASPPVGTSAIATSIGEQYAPIVNTIRPYWQKRYEGGFITLEVYRDIIESYETILTNLQLIQTQVETTTVDA